MQHIVSITLKFKLPLSLDGEWSDWSEWDNCTAECGGGNQTRTRSCTNPEPQFNGTDCDGENSETQICNDEPCEIGTFAIYSHIS